MDFKDFSKEARLKEEARINDLTNKVVAKATKMALDKFSKVYGITTKVAAQKTDLKEFKHNYLSGKIASVLSIDTKNGVKEVPFTILVKASEPSILESDAIMQDKIANTEGSLEKEINAILARQNQKLANYEVEEENNKKIIADLSKGISLEASRKEHIFKEAKKGKKEVGHNSLSTVTTPTNIFNKLVDYFTYPKTFFPPMKVGAIVDIGGVKYKYIGDEATMTEPAGNTNGTIARFELANKKKASLNVKAIPTEPFAAPEDVVYENADYIILLNTAPTIPENIGETAAVYTIKSNLGKDTRGGIIGQCAVVVNDAGYALRGLKRFPEELEPSKLSEDTLMEAYSIVQKDYESRIANINKYSAKEENLDKKADDLKYLRLSNLLNEYKYDGLISDTIEMDGKKILASTPETINDLEHKVKDIGFYCDVITDNEDNRFLRIYIEDKAASENIDINKKADLQTVDGFLTQLKVTAAREYNFEDEDFLNTDFSEISQKGYGTLNSVMAAVATKYGYRTASSLYNIVKTLKKNNKTKIKDLVEVAAGKAERQKARESLSGSEKSEVKDLSKDEKRDFFAEKEDVLNLSERDSFSFFKNDDYVEDNIKNWGISPEDASLFIDSRNYYNEGLPKNDVNTKLVEVACQDPKSALKALNFLFRSGAEEGDKIIDDTKIDSTYKKMLFQAASKGDPYKNLKDFPEALVDKYAFGEGVSKVKEEINPVEDYGDGAVVIEENVRKAIKTKTPEELAEYCKKYNIIEVLKKEIEDLKNSIKSYTKEQRAEVGTTFEEDIDEETGEFIEKEESLKVKADDEQDKLKEQEEQEEVKEKLKNQFAQEDFREDFNKEKEDYGGESTEKPTSISDVETKVDLEKVQVSDDEDEDNETNRMVDKFTKGVKVPVLTEIDELRVDYKRYKLLKNLLEKLEDKLSKVNGENND